MKQWIADYIKAQKAAHDSIPVDGVAQMIEKLPVFPERHPQFLDHLPRTIPSPWTAWRR